MVKKITKSFVEAENDFNDSPFKPYDVENESNFYILIDNEKYPIWSYSPYGYTVKDFNKKLVKSDKVNVEVCIGEYLGEYEAIVVQNALDNNLSSLRTFTIPKDHNLFKEERQSRRWFCQKEFLPTGTAPNPILYGDMVFFRIEEFSFGGFSFLTSMRNKFIQRGMRFDSTLVLPSVGTTSCSFIVKHISVKNVKDKEMLLIGVSFVDKDEIFRRSIAEYLILFAEGISLKTLREDGFEIKKVSKFLDFSYVKSIQDYKSVLELRYQSYKEAGKLSEGVSAGELADEYDDRAKVLMVKYKGRLIGTGRFMFFDKISDSYYADAAGINELPFSISECVEAASVCIDDFSRGSDIFYEILSHTILSTIKSNRRYILAGSTEKLLPFYKSAGFEKLEIPYKSKRLGNVAHELIVMDTHKVALGENISIKNWNRLYSDLVNFMIDKEYLYPTKKDLLRINFYRKMGIFRK